MTIDHTSDSLTSSTQAPAGIFSAGRGAATRDDASPGKSQGRSPSAAPAGLAMEFRVIREGSTPRRLRLTGTRYTFGSAEGCSIRLSDASLRPMHAVLLHDPTAVTLRCYSEPVPINGVPRLEATLSVGDVVQLGTYQFSLINRESPSFDRMPEFTGPEPDAIQSPAKNLGPSDIEIPVVSPEPVSVVGSTLPPEEDGLWRQRLRDEIDQWRRRQRECEVREEELRERETDLWRRAEEIQERDATVRSREGTLKSREAELADLEANSSARAMELDELRQRADRQSATLRDRETELETRRNELKSQEERYQSRLDDAARQLMQSQQQADAATASVSRIREQFESLNRQVDELIAQQTDLEARERQSVEQQKIIRDDLERQRGQVSEAELARDSAIARREEAEKQLEQSEQARQHAERNRIEADDACQHAESIADAKAREVQMAGERLDELSRQVADLREQAIAETTNKDVQLRESRDEIDLLRDQIEQLQATVETARTESQSLRERCHSANEKVRELEESAASMQDHASSLADTDQLRSAMDHLSLELARANEELSQVRRKNETLTAELDGLREQRDQALEREAELTEKVANSVPREDYESLQSELDSVREQLSRSTVEHEAIDRHVADAEEELALSEKEASATDEAAPIHLTVLSDDSVSVTQIDDGHASIDESPWGSQSEEAPLVDADSTSTDAEGTTSEETPALFDFAGKDSDNPWPTYEATESGSEQALEPEQALESEAIEPEQAIESEDSMSGAENDLTPDESVDAFASSQVGPAFDAMDERYEELLETEGDTKPSVSEWFQAESETSEPSDWSAGDTDSALDVDVPVASEEPESVSVSQSFDDSESVLDPAMYSSFPESVEKIEPSEPTTFSSTEEWNQVGADDHHGNPWASESEGDEPVGSDSESSWNDPVETPDEMSNQSESAFAHNEAEPTYLMEPIESDESAASNWGANASSDFEAEGVHEAVDALSGTGNHDFQSHADDLGADDLVAEDLVAEDLDESGDPNELGEMNAGSLASMLISDLEAADSEPSGTSHWADDAREEPSVEMSQDIPADGTYLMTSQAEDLATEVGNGDDNGTSYQESSLYGELADGEEASSYDGSLAHVESEGFESSAGRDEYSPENESDFASNDGYSDAADHEVEASQSIGQSESLVSNDSANEESLQDDSAAGEVDDDSIEAYMNRLLGRVQGQPGSEKATAESVSMSSVTKSRKAEESDVSESIANGEMGADAGAESVVTEHPDEPIVPRSQAPEKNSDLSAMRQLANETARSAISVSAKKQSRQIQMQAIFHFMVAGVCILIGGIATAVVAPPILYVSWLMATIATVVSIKQGYSLWQEAQRRASRG